MSLLYSKFKDTLYSVLPIVLIVVLLHFLVVPLDTDVFIRFLIGSVLLTIGLTLFILGVDIGITPIGNHLGHSITKSNNLFIVIFASIIVGIIITVAEPSLLILANQVDMVTAGAIPSNLIVIFVSLGTGIMLSIGTVRILYAFQIKYLLLIFYLLAFVLALFSKTDFLAISFDASGATTGALAVPFILAIATGTSASDKNSLSKESDSFGLVGIASIGAILAVLVMGVAKNTGALQGELQIELTEGILQPFLKNFLPQIIEVMIIFLPILIVYILANAVSFKLDKISFFRICIGIVFSIVGLTLFLLGVNQGFMDVGSILGAGLASKGNTSLLIIISFILGVVTILAEPAVHILTRQIEEITSGYVKSSLVMATLSIGVGIAIVLSMLRIIIPGLMFWHIALPGFAIAIILSFFSPDLFVGIAFDSGGVASGPMTATFVLAFIQGASNVYPTADILLDGFGVIALVAMTPLIALQILGLVYKLQSNKATQKSSVNTIGDEILNIASVDETDIEKENVNG